MGKGSEDTNPIGTKTGGWIKCADGFWHTEIAASGKTFNKSSKTNDTKAAPTTAPTKK